MGLLAIANYANAASNRPLHVEPDSIEEGTTIVYLEHSETLSFDEARLPDAQVLRGDVVFRHDSIKMYCDSAYFYEKKNSLDAFGNVRILQGDTLAIYGDKLYYDGNTRIARLRRNVLLENKGTILTTDSLNYNRGTNVAYYYTGGTIKDSLNTLSSRVGTYYSNTDVAYFKYNVLLVNDNFTLESDSLQYNTKTNIADLVDTTHIVYQEETTIIANNGWYNTANEQSLLLDQSQIMHKDGTIMLGDSILYNKQTRFAEVFGNMELTDTVQKATLYGDYGQYDEVKETGLATKEPLFVDWSSTDSIFLHADTLYATKDSIYNKVRAFRGVRLYKSDAQMVCDSLIYTDKDSTISLYSDPILWSGNTQISSDFILVYLQDSVVDRALFTDRAIAIRQIDSIRFDQLSGKEIIAHMDSGQLHKVDVSGNAETVFFPAEEDGTLLGVNKTVSSFITMFFKDQKIERAIFTSETNGTMYPLDQLTIEETRLANFYWADKERPTSKRDVFSNPSRTVRASSGASSASAASQDLSSKQTDRKRGRNNTNKETNRPLQGNGFQQQGSSNRTPNTGGNSRFKKVTK